MISSTSNVRILLLRLFYVAIALAVVIMIASFFAAVGSSNREHWMTTAPIEQVQAEAAKRPDDRELLFSLAYRLAKNGNGEDALSIMKRLATVEPRSERYRMGMARCAAQSGHLVEAVDAYKAVCELDNKQSEAHSYLGQIYAKAGLVSDGLEEIEKARQIDANAPVNVVVWAQCLLATGRTQEAWDVVQRSLEGNPAQDPVYPIFTELGLRLGKTSEVEDKLLFRVSLSPMYAVAPARLGLARLVLARSHDPAALQQAEEYARLALSQKSPDASAQLARIQLLQKDIKGARATLEEGLLVDPKHVDCLHLLADVYDRQGSSAEARKLRDRLKLLDPPTSTPQTKALEAEVRSAPDDIGKRTRLAAGLEKIGAFGEAAEQYRQVTNRAPTDQDALARLNACRLAALQKLERSEQAKAGD